MGPFNSNDMRDSKPRLAPGTEWFLRHNKRFRVRILSIKDNMVRIRHLVARAGKRTEVVGRYGFLQVYKPVVPA